MEQGEGELERQRNFPSINVFHLDSYESIDACRKYYDPVEDGFFDDYSFEGGQFDANEDTIGESVTMKVASCVLQKRRLETNDKLQTANYASHHSILSLILIPKFKFQNQMKISIFAK